MSEYMCDALIYIAAHYKTKDGCLIRIYNSKAMRCIDEINVKTVSDCGVITGISTWSKEETAYDITDGIIVLPQ